ncbi:zf-CCHC domain-containing protein [Tanacetum coccineum]
MATKGNGDRRIQRLNKKEKYKSLTLNARQLLSDDDISSSDSNDEEYAMAVRDFKKFFRRRGKFVRQPYDDKRNFRKIKEDKKEDRRCFKCGDPNHFISDCPKNSFGDQKAFVVGNYGVEELDKGDDEIFWKVIESSRKIQFVGESMWGTIQKTFTKKETKKKAFQDMLHELGEVNPTPFNTTMVHKNSCDPLALVDGFTPIEDNIGLLDTRFDEEAVFMFVFPKDVTSLVNLTLLSLFFGVTATNTSLELLMLRQCVW